MRSCGRASPIDDAHVDRPVRSSSASVGELRFHPEFLDLARQPVVGQKLQVHGVAGASAIV